MLRFYNEDRRLELGVHDLLSSGPQKGDLHMQVAWSAKTRMRQGQIVHTNYQASRAKSDASFQKEVTIRQQLVVRGWDVSISGRIDGLCVEGDDLVVEEIKSSTLPGDRLQALTLEKVPDWKEQVEVYLYFLAAQGKSAIGRLVLVSIADGTIVRLPVSYNPETSRSIESRLEYILFEQERRQAWLAERASALSVGLPFAHNQWRPGQLEMTESLRGAISAGKNTLLCASTGYGKTAAALYAAIMEAYRTGKKIYYATARTTQQRMAEDTIELMAERGLPVRAISIRARDKICLNEQVACHKDSCPYAQNYHDKLLAGDLIAKAWTAGHPKGLAWPHAIVEIAETFQVCPFAFGMDLASRADVVIGDYNYLYDPSIRLPLIANDPSDWICIVDEAHNLPSRAMGYGSPTLSFNHAWAALERTQFVDPLLAAPMRELVDFLRRGLQAIPAGQEAANESLGIDDKTAINKIASAIEAVALNYALRKMKSPIFTSDEEDSWMVSARAVMRLKSALDRSGEETLFIWKSSRYDLPELGLFAQPNKIRDAEVGLRLLCRDPSNWLGPIHEKLHAVVFMSATLRPFEFYKDMFGLDADRCIEQICASPFPPERRAAYLLPQVSTAYRHRDRDRQKTAQLISQVMAKTPGNVAVYFPSFSFLSAIEPLLSIGDRHLLMQRRGMSELERYHMLEQLRTMTSAVLLGVLGGIFSEGIDLPGDSLACAVVVGPSLPQANLSRKLIASFYEERYGQGFRYGWLVPGMSRVAQAAGRVIRGPSDRGTVVLIGRRFLRKEFQDFIPEMWSLERSDNITEALNAFWGGE